jgi:hypothetical protein
VPRAVEHLLCKDEALSSNPKPKKKKKPPTKKKRERKNLEINKIIIA